MPVCAADIIINFFRSGRSRAVPQDHIIWPYIWGSLMRYPDGWSQCRVNRDVERASGDCIGVECPRCGLHNQGV